MWGRPLWIAFGLAAGLCCMACAGQEPIGSPPTPRPTLSVPPPPGPSPAPCNNTTQDLAALADCLPVGSFAWNPPSEMRVGDRAEVTARTRRIPPSSLASGIAGPGAPVTGTTPVGEFMAMDLFSSDQTSLRVDPVDPLHREQPIPQRVGDMFAEWNWLLTANEAGSWSLELRAFVSVQGQNIPVQEVWASCGGPNRSSARCSTVRQIPSSTSCGDYFRQAITIGSRPRCRSQTQDRRYNPSQPGCASKHRQGDDRGAESGLRRDLRAIAGVGGHLSDGTRFERRRYASALWHSDSYCSWRYASILPLLA